MKMLRVFLLSWGLVIISGCSYYPDINGRVVDGTTGKPIEGAVVVAQWTKFHGWLGEQQRDLHKIVETLTDKDGKFSLSGDVGFVLDPPQMIIFKEGYIPWRNDSIFPNKDLDKHEWKNNVTYKLDVFTDKYTAKHLYSFMDSGIIGRGGRETPIISELMHKISKQEQAEIEKQMRKDK